MDYSYQCVGLNSVNDTLVLDNNPTNNIIEVQPTMWPPIITYEEELKATSNTSILYYRYCGPLIVLLKIFASYIKTNVKILPHVKDFERHLSDYSLRSPEEEVHLTLFPYCPTKSVDDILNSYGFTLTRYVGTFERSSIASQTDKKEWSLFSHFQCFDIQTYYSIIISIVMIAIVLCTKSRLIIEILEIVSNYAVVVLSGRFSRQPITFMARTFACLWLLVCIVLLATFTGNLWDLMIRKQPIDRIDSWNDLYTKPHWRESKIYVPKYFEMHDFIEYDTSEMASDFKKRSEIVDSLSIIFNKSLIEELIDKGFKDNSVLTFDSLVLHYFKNKLKFKVIIDNSEGYDYHISESGFGIKPYFLTKTRRVDKTMAKKLDFIITQLDENGIYEHEVKKSLKPKGFGSDINVKVEVNAYEFAPLTLKQLRGAFVVLFMGLSLAFLAFLIEMSTKSKDKIHNLVTDVLANSRIVSYLLEIYHFYIRQNRVHP